MSETNETAGKTATDNTNAQTLTLNVAVTLTLEEIAAFAAALPLDDDARDALAKSIRRAGSRKANG